MRLLIALNILLLAIASGSLAQSETDPDIFEFKPTETTVAPEPELTNIENTEINEGSDTFEVSTAMAETFSEPMEIDSPSKALAAAAAAANDHNSTDTSAMSENDGENEENIPDPFGNYDIDAEEETKTPLPAVAPVAPEAPVASAAPAVVDETTTATTILPTFTTTEMSLEDVTEQILETRVLKEKEEAMTTAFMPVEATTTTPLPFEPITSVDPSLDSTTPGTITTKMASEHVVVPESSQPPVKIVEETSSTATVTTATPAPVVVETTQANVNNGNAAHAENIDESMDSEAEPFDSQGLSGLFEPDGSPSQSSKTETPAFPIVHLPEENESIIKHEQVILPSSVMPINLETTTVEMPKVETTEEVEEEKTMEEAEEEKPMDEAEEFAVDNSQPTEKATEPSTEVNTETSTETMTDSEDEEMEMAMSSTSSSNGSPTIVAATTTTGAAVPSDVVDSQATSTEEADMEEENIEVAAPVETETSDNEMAAENPEEMENEVAPTVAHKPVAAHPEVAGHHRTPLSIRLTSVDYVLEFADNKSGKFRKLKDQVEPQIKKILEEVLEDNYVNFEVSSFTQGSVVVHGDIISKYEINAEDVASKIEGKISSNEKQLGQHTVDPKGITVNGMASRNYIDRVHNIESSAPSAFLIGSVITVAVIVVLVVAILVICLYNRRSNGGMKLKEDELSRTEKGSNTAYDNPSSVNLKSYNNPDHISTSPSMVSNSSDRSVPIHF